MDLGEARAATVTSNNDAPVVVVTGDAPFVLLRSCDADGCEIVHADLDVADGATVILTSQGRYAVTIRTPSTPNVQVFEILTTPRTLTEADKAEGASPWIVPLETSLRPNDDTTPQRLVAGMRGSDWIVTRTRNGELGRYLPPNGDTPEQAGLIAEGLDDLNVVAIGEHYLIGRVIHSSDEDSLYLVPVDPGLDGEGPIRLMRGPTVARALLTADDERVVVTAGSGDSAETFVFGVPDGELLDRFVGAIVSGTKLGEEVPGLRGASPDGSHAAYRTASGALAMRALDLGSSCLVRSSTAGDHRVAGFAADGVLFAEAADGLDSTTLLAFDPKTRDMVSLGQSDNAYHLAAVAAEMPEDDDAGREYWATAVSSGTYATVSSNGPDTPLQGLRDASFMSRDGDSVWVLETFTPPDERERSLGVRRIAPSRTDVGLQFSESTREAHRVVTEALGTPSDVCVSTGVPGAWAHQCKPAGSTSSTYFSTNSGQAEEDPEQRLPEPPDPEEPDDDDDE